MTNHFFSFEKVLKRLHEGPLGVYIDAYAGMLREKGYAERTAKEKIRIVADLSRWLDRQ